MSKEPNYFPRKSAYTEERQPMRVTGKRAASPSGERSTVTDEITGKSYRIRRASCGLKCRCDAVILHEVEVKP